MYIKISVNNKIATLQDNVQIVNGNSDYVIKFDFDAEWDAYETKTARFVTARGYTDVVFSGDEVALPVFTDAISVRVGVYAGNLHTTTPAVIFCRRCITDGSGSPVEPTPDVYAQIMEMLNKDSGISTTAKNLLITILRSGVYTDDQSNNITALDTALGGGEVPDIPDVPAEPDVPVVKTYTITRELINVTSNNNQNSISEGASYTETLSPNVGYLLPSTLGGSVTITMGGTDITSEVYNYVSGEIAITSVTGNIVIQATAFEEPKLIADGLESFFDLRSAAITTSGNYKYIGATRGNGGLFYNNVDKEVTYKGIVFGTDRPTYTLSGNIEWNDYAGTDNQYTIVTCYYAPEGHNYSVPFPNAVLSSTFPNWYPTMKYINTSGTSVTVTSDVPVPSAQAAGFMVGAVSVGADKAVFATADGVLTTIEASNCADFSSFAAYSQEGLTNPNRATDSVTFYAVYNRALSIAEMTEVLNYMITEVNK